MGQMPGAGAAGGTGEMMAANGMMGAGASMLPPGAANMMRPHAYMAPAPGSRHLAPRVDRKLASLCAGPGGLVVSPRIALPSS